MKALLVALLGVFLFVGSANAQAPQSYAELVAQVDSAVESGDQNLLASIVVSAYNDGLSYADEVLKYAVKVSPDQAVFIMTALQSSVPGQAQEIAAVISDTLSANGASEELVSAVAAVAGSDVAAGGQGDQQGGGAGDDGQQLALGGEGGNNGGIVENPGNINGSAN